MAGHKSTKIHKAKPRKNVNYLPVLILALIAILLFLDLSFGKNFSGQVSASLERTSSTHPSQLLVSQQPQTQEFQIQQGVCYCDSCESCTAALNNESCTEVYLTTDIINYGGTCINNPENFTNKVFDCQGHEINGNGVQDVWPDSGIYLSGKTGNTIRNCIISAFDYGIYLHSSSNNDLVNDSANSNRLSGVFLEASSNYNNIINDSAENNSYYGFYLYSSSNNSLENNIAENNYQGFIIFSNSNNNDLIHNTANNNGYGGIYLYASLANNLIENNASYNSGYYEASGIYLLFSNGNNLLGNNASNNGWYGVWLASSSGNNLSTNFANNNGWHGFYTPQSSSNNNLTNNTANNNGWYGFYATSDSTNNVLYSNRFCSNSQYDIYDADSNTGDDNTCDTTYNYNDTGTTGCTYSCGGAPSLCECDSCESCTAALNDSSCSVVYLTANITNYGGTCIDNPENFSNKTFDCQWHEINGNGIYDGWPDSGIYLFGKTGNIIRNCIISAFNDGVWLDTNSNYNTLINNTLSNNSDTGMYLGNVYYANISDNKFTNSWAGIYLHSSYYNNLTNNFASNNEDSGLYLIFSENNILQNNTADNNSNGIYLRFSSNNILTGNNLEANLEWDFYSEFDSLNNSVTNLKTGIPGINFESKDIALKSVSAPPEDPPNYKNISKYVNATNNAGDSWLFLNISYNDSDLNGIDESTLRIAKYGDNSGTWETNCSNFANSCGVDTVNNYVYANITDFGSIFAPLGETGGAGAGNNTGEIRITIESVLSITLPDALVDFGTGYVASGYTYAILDSNSTELQNWTVVENGSNGWPSNTDYIILENNGNIYANVTIKANKTASEFIGGTNPEQYFAAMDNESGSCQNNLQSDYTELQTSENTICGNLSYANDADSLRIMFKLKIPSDATPDVRSNIITFIAYPLSG